MNDGNSGGRALPRPSTERSFGAYAERGLSTPRRGPIIPRGAKLWSACSSLPLSLPQACLRQFLPASSLAGISTPASICIRIPSLQARVPARSPRSGACPPLRRGPVISRGAKLWSACSLLPLSLPQACLREFPPPPRSVFAFLPCKHESQPASWLGQKRQQAARTPKLRSVCHKGHLFQSFARVNRRRGARGTVEIPYSSKAGARPPSPAHPKAAEKSGLAPGSAIG